MKILITGGTGFIGGYLIKDFISKGRDIRCLIRTNSDISSLSKLKLEIIRGDLTDRHSLEEAVKGVEVVYHLAAVTDLPPNRIDLYQLVNREGTRNMLEVSLRAGVKKFIYFSSIAAVGPSKNGLVLNEDSLPNPITPYGRSKYEAEKISLQFFRDYKLPVVIIRPSNVYGPGALSGYMPAFIRAVNKKIFFTFGSGNLLMSFCYIDNLITGALLAEEKSLPGQTYFISDEQPYTINDIVGAIAAEEAVKLLNIYIPLWCAPGLGYSLNLLSKTIKSLPTISKETLKNFSTNLWICDISKAKRELGYLPKVGLREGIKQTVSWFKNFGHIN